jgi:hypothetical protein
MNTQNIVHDIALCWKNTSRDVRPYARFDEYFLSPYKTADFHNHIHIYYHSKTFKPGYAIKINNKQIERKFISNKYSAKKWCKILLKKFLTGIKKTYKNTICNKLKTKKNKTLKNLNKFIF